MCFFLFFLLLILLHPFLFSLTLFFFLLFLFCNQFPEFLLLLPPPPPLLPSVLSSQQSKHTDELSPQIKSSESPECLIVALPFSSPEVRLTSQITISSIFWSLRTNFTSEWTCLSTFIKADHWVSRNEMTFKAAKHKTRTSKHHKHKTGTFRHSREHLLGHCGRGLKTGLIRTSGTPLHMGLAWTFTIGNGGKGENGLN